jgi:uncharacterized protein (TIGR02145 family)
MAANTNGLIYYKLDANVNGYSGDITKNCGLRGEEIDGNFNFLRGHDIKEISFDESGTMYLTRYNGEILVAKPADKPSYDFKYDSDNGTLTIVTPEGKEIVLTGFKVVTTVYHDYSLEGYGSAEEPLSISNIAKTGRYKPAIKLLDTTLEDEEGQRLEPLPTTNVAKHDRYVTREKVSKFGKLFPLKGVELIADRLKAINSEWRVPTKKDWDAILNTIDCAEPNHSDEASNVFLGEFAGSALKSTSFWKASSGKMLSEDMYGFAVQPVGYAGNRGKGYYGSFGESAAFWTSSEEDTNKDMYVKLFEYDTEKVGQRTWGENYYLSLRLVKTFTGDNFNDAEDIDGFTSNCVHIPGTSLIWTKDNIAFSNTQYDGFSPDLWKEYENVDTDDKSYDIRYFVNDWNGNGWDKHEIAEGEGIVLYEGANGVMHEWILVDGELVDTSVLLKEEFHDELNELRDKIDTEIHNREKVDKDLWVAINNEASFREETDTRIWNSIAQEVADRTSVDNQLWEAINKEAATREEIDNSQWEAINKEVADREADDEVIFNNLKQETEDRIAVDNQIWDKLNTEINERVTQANEIQQQIDENKVTPENNSVVIVPGNTVDEQTVATTIKVNLDIECEHLKLGDNGIYFDGYFGQF